MQKYRLLYASFFAGSKLHRMAGAETKVDILVHALHPVGVAAPPYGRGLAARRLSFSNMPRGANRHAVELSCSADDFPAGTSEAQNKASRRQEITK